MRNDWIRLPDVSNYTPNDIPISNTNNHDFGIIKLSNYTSSCAFWPVDKYLAGIEPGSTVTISKVNI